MFTPSRLTLARQRRGMKKTELARTTGLSTQSISNYENGVRIPNEESLAALSTELRFPESFFERESIEPPSADGVSFRALASMTAGQRDMALSAGAFAIEVNRWVEGRFTLPACDLPDYRGFAPEEAAEAIRAHWGLGSNRCPNAVHLLESRGVRVYSVPRDSKAVHAFSFWDDETPFVLLTTDTSGERGRFDSAHELGHLLLHRYGTQAGPAAEREADQFASAFLLPFSSVITRAPQSPTIPRLTKLKLEWGVSIGALVVRLRHLELISSWQYRQLCIEISQRGYRTKEPNGIDREKSMVFKKVVDLMRESKLSRRDLATDIGIFVRELDGMTFGWIDAISPTINESVIASS